jgi:hypothetical protein
VKVRLRKPICIQIGCGSKSALVDENWPAIKRVALALFKHKRLSGEQIDKLIAPFQVNKIGGPGNLPGQTSSNRGGISPSRGSNRRVLVRHVRTLGRLRKREETTEMHLSERRVRDLFAHHGYKIERIEIGKHRKVWASCGGRTQRFIIANTPSDRRALKQIRAELKCRGRLPNEAAGSGDDLGSIR